MLSLSALSVYLLIVMIECCVAQWQSVDDALAAATGSLPRVHMCGGNTTIVAAEPLPHRDPSSGLPMQLRITILEVVLPQPDMLRVVALVQDETEESSWGYSIRVFGAPLEHLYVELLDARQTTRNVRAKPLQISAKLHTNNWLVRSKGIGKLFEVDESCDNDSCHRHWLVVKTTTSLLWEIRVYCYFIVVCAVFENFENLQFARHFSSNRFLYVFESLLLKSLEFL
jgi:hypothetical protein